MSQEELNYILKMLDEGSFSKAAEKLYTSQPSLYLQGKRLRATG
ncbi:transcriptional regulator [Desulfitobacterium dichloroeliminans LMG P-21439]|uniref:Transcriptional regulator n=1 Tax=Desulfitobacterium dichloroeliminans (strain LMG P-21439 / DCA1) TaxID=871963 RepID=L0F3U2_DESDL|nr:LysR family transcriptional regulator [Desulfitobacterium dichloroeliminans]AGA67847.1 transcriptional regulator [Desulfitobacterium dichloroeliminans LMG P-21439]